MTTVAFNTFCLFKYLVWSWIDTNLLLITSNSNVPLSRVGDQCETNLQALLLSLLKTVTMFSLLFLFLLQPSHLPTSHMSSFQCVESKQMMGDVTILLSNRASCELWSCEQIPQPRNTFMVSVSIPVAPHQVILDMK